MDWKLMAEFDHVSKIIARESGRAPARIAGILVPHLEAEREHRASDN